MGCNSPTGARLQLVSAQILVELRVKRYNFSCGHIRLLKAFHTASPSHCSWLEVEDEADDEFLRVSKVLTGP